MDHKAIPTARGAAEPTLICAIIILPPNRAATEIAMMNMVQSNAVVLCENPMSSNQSVANENNADHGIDPDTPCATITRKDGILITDFTSFSISFILDSVDH
ncbi:uncharacterized protein DS421_12g382200 [Arachis hypogaea]|nr:uncharacterized protein DS421_12g382200 [Arachis hypogaea]